MKSAILSLCFFVVLVVAFSSAQSNVTTVAGITIDTTIGTTRESNIGTTDESIIGTTLGSENETMSTTTSGTMNRSTVVDKGDRSVDKGLAMSTMPCVIVLVTSALFALNWSL